MYHVSVVKSGILTVNCVDIPCIYLLFEPQAAICFLALRVDFIFSLGYKVKTQSEGINPIGRVKRNNTIGCIMGNVVSYVYGN